MAKLEPMTNGYYLWHYIPSIAAGVIFSVLFFLIAAFHLWKLYTTKALFALPFAIGGLFEIIGYAARVAAHGKTGELLPYVIQSVFLLLAPILFAAAVYIVLARIIRSINAEQYSPIRFNWVTNIFVSCDIVTFLIQGSGAGMMAIGSMSKMGQKIVLTGLILQIVTFVLFMGTAIVFEKRVEADSTPEATQGVLIWKKHLLSLYAVSAMILLRSVFRVIEYGMGNHGYLLVNEWPTYVLDAVPMFIAMICFAYWYPSELQPSLIKSESETEMASV